jgi:hypothetical protein
MIVIVGGGPSAAESGMGALIDRQYVVRMKHAKRDPDHRGMRMDAYFSRGYSAKKLGYDFWFFPKRPPHPEGCDSPYWLNFYSKFSRLKPSTGLCALFCAAEFYPKETIGLIGYDTVLDNTRFTVGPHDSGGEWLCVKELPLNIIDLRSEHGKAYLREAQPTQKQQLRGARPQVSDRGREPREERPGAGESVRYAYAKG